MQFSTVIGRFVYCLLRSVIHC